MSIVRIKRTTKPFDYEGDRFGIRHQTAKEQQTITEMFSLWQRSVKTEVKDLKAANVVDEVTASGDLDLFMNVQKYVAKTLTVDLETGTQIFGDDPEKEKIN